MEIKRAESTSKVLVSVMAALSFEVPERCMVSVSAISSLLEVVPLSCFSLPHTYNVHMVKEKCL